MIFYLSRKNYPDDYYSNEKIIFSINIFVLILNEKNIQPLFKKIVLRVTIIVYNRILNAEKVS